MPLRISQETAWKVVTKYREDPTKSKAQMARECDVSPHTVQSIISRIKANPCNPNPMPVAPPRPRARAISQEVAVQIVAFSQEHPFATAHQIKREFQLACSVTTVMRRLRDAGIRCQRPARKSKLSPHHKQERLQFAQDHLPPFDWNRVLFTDEATISTALDNGVHWVRRRRGDRFMPKNVVELRPRSGRVSIAVWASMSSDGPQHLVRVNGKLDTQQYHRRMLVKYVAPWIRADSENRIFQQDNSPIHTATTVKGYLRRANINYMIWPACSPDLSPIENFWDRLKREVGDTEFPGPTLALKKEQLWMAINTAFTNLKNPDTVTNYYASMQTRMNAVITAQGGHTRY